MVCSNQGTLYRRVRKMELVTAGLVNCGYCKYNRDENRKRKPRRDRYKNIDRLTPNKMEFITGLVATLEEQFREVA